MTAQKGTSPIHLKYIVVRKLSGQKQKESCYLFLNSGEWDEMQWKERDCSSSCTDETVGWLKQDFF